MLCDAFCRFARAQRRRRRHFLDFATHENGFESFKLVHAIGRGNHPRSRFARPLHLSLPRSSRASRREARSPPSRMRWSAAPPPSEAAPHGMRSTVTAARASSSGAHARRASSFKQRGGLNYDADDIYGPVMDKTTLRILLIIGNSRDFTSWMRVLSTTTRGLNLRPLKGPCR